MSEMNKNMPPKGFDPKNAPKGFDPKNAPPGFDPKKGPPKGFDPSRMGPPPTMKGKNGEVIVTRSKYAAKDGARPRRRGGPGGRGGPPGMPGEKAKNFKGSLRRLIKYIGKFKWALLLVALLCILSSIANIFSPRVQGFAINVIDQAYRSGMLNTGELLKWILVLGSIYIATSLFSFIQQWTSIGVSQNLVRMMRSDVDEKLSKLPLKYYDTNTHGEILSRVTNDIDNVSNTLQQSMTQIISSIITLVGVLIMMFSINWILTLVTLAITPLYILVVYFIAPRSQRYFVGQQAALGDINGHVEEMYTGHKIVKAYGHEEESIEEFEEINHRYYTYSIRAQFISGMIMPISRMLGNLGYVLVCVIGGIFVASGRLLLGDIQSFTQYVRQFNQPIQQVSGIANTLQSTIASAERIFDILDQVEEPADIVGAITLEKPQGAVKFEHVQFGYTEDNILMQDLSIDVKPGETIAIVGPTGAGKTTLVNLLMRFYDVNGSRTITVDGTDYSVSAGKVSYEGTSYDVVDGKVTIDGTVYEVKGGGITIDGVDIRDMPRNSLRSLFGMVLQDTWLFNGSIRDNIAYGRPDATEEQIVAASKAARADHFIRTLPDGYNTEINEEASNISQGQRQLLTIARAFLADPEILILDEATSSVDTRTEVLIQTAMNELMKSRTSFVIAHRLSTIRHADLILVMNHGTIVEQGTHESLLADGGFYAELWQSQFAAQSLDDVG